MFRQHYITAQQSREPEPFEELVQIFDALDDDELIERLQATRWTGRPGYPVRVMWHVMVASFYLNVIHDTDMIRALRSNPLLAHACGIDGTEGIPSKYAICRFRKKLMAFNDLIATVLSRCVESLRERIPGFADGVAVDSTDLAAWANSFHKDTDPDAGTGAKKKSDHRYPLRAEAQSGPHIFAELLRKPRFTFHPRTGKM